MILTNGKFISATFANGQKNVILAIWKDSTTEQLQEVAIQTNLEDRLYTQLLEAFTVDEISTMTDQRNAAHKAAFEEMVMKMARDHGLVYDATAAAQKDRLSIDHIFNPPEGDAGSDLLFDIKLKIFDLPQVVDSKDAELKAELRKATTPLQAFYVAGKFLYK